ncbi:MAG TPA: hypothetical protein VN229_17160 [Terriglobales bacterium]|nr:hypothetical protein [Terriglobales bacterium]
MQTGVSAGKLLRICTVIALMSLLTGCGRMILDKAADTTSGKMAREIADEFQRGEVDRLIAQFDPALHMEEHRADMQRAKVYFPPELPSTVELVSWSCVVDGKGTGDVAAAIDPCRYDVQFEYSYAQIWRLVRVEFRIGPQGPILWYLGVFPLSAPLEDTFSITNLKPLGLGAIMIALLNTGLMILTLVWTWREPRPRWPWLWRVALLCGVGSWNVSCLAGASAWQTWSIGLPVSWANWGLFQPLIVTSHVPIFIFAYWLRQGARRDRQWLEAQEMAAKFD